MPNYKERKDWLRINGAGLDVRSRDLSEDLRRTRHTANRRAFRSEPDSASSSLASAYATPAVLIRRGAMQACGAGSCIFLQLYVKYASCESEGYEVERSLWDLSRID